MNLDPVTLAVYDGLSTKPLYLENSSPEPQMREGKKETFLQDEILVPTLCSPAQGLPGPFYAWTGLVLCFCMMRENTIPILVHGIRSALHSPTIPASPSLLDLELDSEWQQLQRFKWCLR